ncbi:hypothetical protein [Elioraea sp.]
MNARAGSAAGVLAAAYWPAMLAGLWWGVALSCTPLSTRRRHD